MSHFGLYKTFHMRTTSSHLQMIHTTLWNTRYDGMHYIISRLFTDAAAAAAAADSLLSGKYDWTSWNLASLGFSLNAPCLSHCTLHPVNVYHAARSVWALYTHSGVEYVKARSPAATDMGHWWRNHNSDVINSTAWYVVLVVYIQLQIESYIFFPTMITIDKRPSPYVAQHRNASACQILPPYVAPFRRR